MPSAVNLSEKLKLIEGHWKPKIVSTFNGHDILIVKVKGEFIWHKHDDTDDFFYVLSGSINIETEQGNVTLNPGELFVVPKGIQHRPIAQEEAHLLVIEKEGTPNTGDPKTAVIKEKI
ncbi:MAG: cupin domain-containing protein [Pseudomonadota bacterium]